RARGTTGGGRARRGATPPAPRPGGRRPARAAPSCREGGRVGEQAAGGGFQERLEGHVLLPHQPSGRQVATGHEFDDGAGGRRRRPRDGPPAATVQGERLV